MRGPNSLLIGLDEVGRGSWAGPLVVAAVILKDEINGLNDSKVLSFKKRAQLDTLIRSKTNLIAVSEISAKIIDKIGLTKAISLAMESAVQDLKGQDYNKIIIDGNYNFLQNLDNVETLIKADAKVPTVMAASIIAKVYRDNLMIKLSSTYPEYGFESNFGYGTKKHIDALKKYGSTPIHRLSYKPVKVLSNR